MKLYKFQNIIKHRAAICKTKKIHIQVFGYQNIKSNMRCKIGNEKQLNHYLAESLLLMITKTNSID